MGDKIKIVKVQRPIGGNDTLNPWLMYDERRTHQTTVPDTLISDEVRNLMGSDYKMFAFAEWRHDEGWKILARVPESKEPRW